MSDHWKSLADKLGAPGVDPLPEQNPTEGNAKEKLAPDPIEATVEEQAEIAAEQLPEATLGDPPAVDDELGMQEPDSELETSEVGNLAEPADPLAPGSTEDVNLEEVLSFKKYREQPKQKLDSSQPGAAGGDDGGRAEETREPQSFDEPEVVQAVKPKEKESSKASKTQAKPEKKPRKKSSWEKLANMFNIEFSSSEDEASTDSDAADDEGNLGEPASAADSSESPSLSIFGEDESGAGDEANPALEAMFAEAPKKSRKDWDKPKRRVVDDLGWDDDEPGSSLKKDEEERYQSEEAEEEISLSFKKKPKDKEEQEEEDEEPRSRRRSRGRGRGRNRGRDRGADSEVKAESPTDWEPEIESPGIEESIYPEDSDEEPEEVERRSNRRRRRGRRAPSDEDRADEPQARESADAERPKRRERKEEEGDSESRRGGKRRRRREPEDSEKRSSVKRPARDDEEDDGEFEVRTHRDVPTWAEAVEPLVENNSQNHRRSENRGRGRSRGRR